MVLPAVKDFFIVRYLQGLSGRTRTVLTSCVYGLAAGLSAVAFQLTISLIYTKGLVRLSHQSLPTFALESLAIIVVSSLIVGILLAGYCPAASGSGIPQLKLAFWKDFGTVPWRIAWVKFVAGVVSIAGGASMGREGPSVQLGGAIASNLAGMTGEAKQSRRPAAAAGAAAALAAAFNAPLAATTFVLEEIIGDLNSRLLGGVLLASVLGALAVHGIIGAQPAFTLQSVDNSTWICYALTPVVAALATLVGVYFQRASLTLRQQSKKTRLLPQWCIPVLGGLVTWTLGMLVFWHAGRMGVFALGYDDLSGRAYGERGMGNCRAPVNHKICGDGLLLWIWGVRRNFFAVPFFWRHGGNIRRKTGGGGMAHGTGRRDHARGRGDERDFGGSGRRAGDGDFDRV